MAEVARSLLSRAPGDWSASPAGSGYARRECEATRRAKAEAEGPEPVDRPLPEALGIGVLPPVMTSSTLRERGATVAHGCRHVVEADNPAPWLLGQKSSTGVTSGFRSTAVRTHGQTSGVVGHGSWSDLVERPGGETDHRSSLVSASPAAGSISTAGNHTTQHARLWASAGSRSRRRSGRRPPR